MKRFPFLLSLLVALLLGACSDDPVQSVNGIVVTGKNLPATENDFHYRLWFSYPEEGTIGKDPEIDHEKSSYFAVGSFTVDGAGTISGLGGGTPVFRIPDGYTPSLIADALLTVEKDGVVDSVPGPVLLAGDFVGTTSRGIDTMTLTGADAFGSRMEEIFAPDSAHRYILDTPTTPDTADNTMGLWFVTPASPAPQPSLRIPAQPINAENPGWRYEAWLIDNRVVGGGNSRYVSLGGFDSPNAKDLNGAGPLAGPNPSSAYDAPGEDFVATPGRQLNSGNYGLLVSLQPPGLALDRPFLTLLHRGDIPEGLEARHPDSLSTMIFRPMLVVQIDR